MNDPGAQSGNRTCPLVLASASPRRKELLAVLTPEFEVDPAEIDETVLSGEAADDYVRRIAEAKAVRVAGRHPRAWVLGSDTAVVLGARILGKPLDRDQARAMLRALSDRTHQVLSAVSLVRDDVGVETRLSRTRVSFARLPEDWIEAYAASGDCDDKAGAYAIQGAAAAWIQDLHGSYSGVVGLPLFETAELLRGAGLMPMLAPVRRPQTKSPP